MVKQMFYSTDRETVKSIVKIYYILCRNSGSQILSYCPVSNFGNAQHPLLPPKKNLAPKLSSLSSNSRITAVSTAPVTSLLIQR